MSVSSGRRRTLPLSKVGVSAMVGKYNGELTPKKVLRFQLPHSTRVDQVLQNYVNGENKREYEQLVCSIRDDVLHDDELIALLDEVKDCIPMLNQGLRLFVEAFLSLKWTTKSHSVIKRYKSLIVNLLLAHNYHTKYAIDHLVSNFIAEDDKEWENGMPSNEDCEKLAHVHFVLNVLLNVIPMSHEILQKSIMTYYPYIKKPTHLHEVYLHNVLWILDYQPDYTDDFFHLIFNRLILLDVNAPREEILKAAQGELEEEIFSMDDDKTVKSFSTQQDSIAVKSQPLAHTLDVCLDKIFNFMITECYDIDTGQLNWEKTRELYHTMVTVFDRVILPTYNIHHVQFVMFFLCSFKITLSEAFLLHLWKKVCDPNVASVHRQTAVGYIASLIARAAFIPISMLKSIVEEMASWILAYISTQDGLESINSDVRIHAVFYSVCQAVFYIIAFRHRDLVNTRKNIAFLESLNLTKMVTCRLNPLRVCQPAIVQNFAAVTRTYQLAYCYTIIEHNARSSMPTVYIDEKGCMTTLSCTLDSFFPFDPYLLKRSGEKIQPLYLEYKSFMEEQEDGKCERMEEDDDFLQDQSGPTTSTCSRSSSRFSYGTSPGFKHKI